MEKKKKNFTLVCIVDIVASYISFKGCHDKVLQTYLLTVLQAGKPKSKVTAWSDEGPLQGCRLLAMFSHGGRALASCSGLFYKGANP